MKTVGKPYISSESILKGRFLTYRIRFTSGGSRSLKKQASTYIDANKEIKNIQKFKKKIITLQLWHKHSFLQENIMRLLNYL